MLQDLRLGKENREALDDLASAILSGGDDTTAPSVLRELGALLGIALDRPADVAQTRG